MSGADEQLSLAARLSSRDNALNAIRLGLALLVIVGHSFPIGGFLPPQRFGDVHGTAVNGFFAISGFLILGSGLRMRTLPFLWRRWLRIYPGYIVAVIVTAFAFAPVAASIGGGGPWSAASAFGYVFRGLDIAPEQGGSEARSPVSRTRASGTDRCGRLATRLAHIWSSHF